MHQTKWNSFMTQEIFLFESYPVKAYRDNMTIMYFSPFIIIDDSKERHFSFQTQGN
jgi:hypothetical protein